MRPLGTTESKTFRETINESKQRFILPSRTNFRKKTLFPNMCLFVAIKIDSAEVVARTTVPKRVELHILF